MWWLNYGHATTLVKRLPYLGLCFPNSMHYWSCLLICLSCKCKTKKRVRIITVGSSVCHGRKSNLCAVSRQAGGYRLMFCFTFLCATAATAVARLSHCNSVCPSVTRVDQSETVQARITKSSPSAAWKTLVSGTIKLFHKFEGVNSERMR